MISKGRKRPPPSPQPSAFGNYTRPDVLQILKRGDPNDSATVLVAATLLASIEPHGPHPGSETVTTPLDVLADSKQPFAKELLWQAAHSASNSRIRVEAIRRAGPTATTPERRQLLRKWAAAGLSHQAQFQHEQLSMETAREAAVTALGNLSTPEADDIETLIEALTPHPDPTKFSAGLFKAATEAFWKVGSIVSLPKVLTVLSICRRDDVGLTLVSLAARFTAAELRPHADAITKAFRDNARTWQTDQVTPQRLTDLAAKLATPTFLLAWVSAFGRDGVTDGRGRITLALLKAVDTTQQETTEPLLILAQSTGNILPDGPVLEALRANAVSNGRTIAARVADQSHPGHLHLLESGGIARVFPSVKSAIEAFASALQTRSVLQQQRAAASRVAFGLLVGAPAAGSDSGLDYELLSQRGTQPRTVEQKAALAHGVTALARLKDDDNPVLIVARLVVEPNPLPGAVALAENWLRPDDDLARYTMHRIIHEAGRVRTVASPGLERIERFLLKPEAQQPVLGKLLQQSLYDEVMVDGRVNRYALDVMQRENLEFEQGARRALAELKRQDDADFLLDRLALPEAGSPNVLLQAVSFHRVSHTGLTTRVQAKAISLATELLLRNADLKSIDAFALQLHDRFQDLPPVREAAYKACGRLGSFVSIKSLKLRLPSEPSSTSKEYILEALSALREKLTEAKPDDGRPEEIKAWLGFVANLGDVRLLQHVSGYLLPPHADHSVRRAALLAVESMRDATALEVVKQFINNTAPEGETLVVARHARLILEDRSDADLFDVLEEWFDDDAIVLDPGINYDNVFGSRVRIAVTRDLKKAQSLRQDGYWDEFVTLINSITEALIRRVFLTRFAEMRLDQQSAEGLARGNYANMLNATPFRTTYRTLQAHANTIQSVRADTPGAHAVNRDGSMKTAATQADADYVRSEFQAAFSEIVRILQ